MLIVSKMNLKKSSSKSLRKKKSDYIVLSLTALLTLTVISLSQQLTSTNLNSLKSKAAELFGQEFQLSSESLQIVESVSINADQPINPSPIPTIDVDRLLSLNPQEARKRGEPEPTHPACNQQCIDQTGCPEGLSCLIEQQRCDNPTCIRPACNISCQQDIDCQYGSSWVDRVCRDGQCRDASCPSSSICNCECRDGVAAILGRFSTAKKDEQVCGPLRITCYGLVPEVGSNTILKSIGEASQCKTRDEWIAEANQVCRNMWSCQTRTLSKCISYLNACPQNCSDQFSQRSCIGQDCCLP